MTLIVIMCTIAEFRILNKCKKPVFNTLYLKNGAFADEYFEESKGY